MSSHFWPPQGCVDSLETVGLYWLMTMNRMNYLRGLLNGVAYYERAVLLSNPSLQPTRASCAGLVG